jgi:hypothetical protein
MKLERGKEGQRMGSQDKIGSAVWQREEKVERSPDAGDDEERQGGKRDEDR